MKIPSKQLFRSGFNRPAIRKFVTALLVPILYCHYAFAQPLPCVNGRIDTVAGNRATAYRFANPDSRTLAVNYLLRICIHIFNNDDGSNTACTAAQLQSELNSLLATYASGNICFLVCETEYRNSTFLNTQFNVNNDPNGTVFAPYRVPNCINIFYMQKINGTNPACSGSCGIGGIAIGGIPGIFFLMSTGNIGVGSSIGHEMGHCLGLYHTFETAFGAEQINGGNSSVTGDKITDTNADPYYKSGTPCYATSNCTYSGSCTDPNGLTNFSPPYTNLMSYWWTIKNTLGATCFPSQVTTSGQFSRVNSFLATYAPLVDCESPENLAINGVTQTGGYYMQTAINSLEFSNVHLYGDIKSTLGAGTIILNPGFSATPNGSGSIHVLPKPCQ